jgi:alginate O-acetyltransferase complex protein AlgJ
MTPSRSETVSVKSASAAPLSREEEAQRDLGGSVFCKWAKAAVVVGFLGMLLAGMSAAWFGRMRGEAKASVAGVTLHATEHPAGNGSEVSSRTLGRLSNMLPSPVSIRAFEKHLEESSGLVARLRPVVQTFLIRWFREGNTQVVVAPGGWLFFQRDLDYVNGAPFLDARRQRVRAERDRVSADPVAAVLDFQRQLSARGIRLVLLPVPVKPCIEGHRLYGPSVGDKRLRQNVSFGPFVERLRSEGVEVLDPAPLLFERLQHTAEAQYLARDTHWTPQSMAAVARALASEVAGGWERARPAGQVASVSAGELESVSNEGDTTTLLGLPAAQALFPPETVQVQPVYTGGMLWKSDSEAEVLLLGDSFSNIYAMNDMGWGNRAGFAEQLSVALGRPVDVLLRNSDGAFATRQMLQRELAKGRDRLAGKKVVVWEFAVRELAFGDWKIISLEMGSEKSTGFYGPDAGARRRVEGTVARVSSVPRPGSVPYRDHIMSVLLEDVVAGGGAGDAVGKQCLVYTWSMRGQRLTKAASLRAGDRVSWELAAWEDVQSEKEKFQRSEFEEPEVLTAPIAWLE